MTTTTEVSVFGVRLRPRSRSEALEALRALLEGGGGPHSVYFVHAATANLAYEDAIFRQALNRGHLVLNDGIGVRWAARSRGVALQENLVGTDLIPHLLALPFARPLRLYLLGGSRGVADRAALYLRERFPSVEIAGCADGYFSASEEREVVVRINRAAPDLLLVGMGNPRQELFIDRCLPHLNCGLALGVGGLFDHWSGNLRRAAPWLRRWGLEWLQLLLQQPHKWRRYLLGNPKFLWRALEPLLLRRLRGAAAVGLSLIFSLLVAEAIVRLTRPQILERYPEGLYVASSTRQYALRPGFSGVFRYPEFQTRVRINAQGLRAGRDYGLPPPGVHRLLAVGDSFTIGYSVEEDQTWVRVLEALLGPSWEVVNAGVPGYSTWQELAWLEEQGLALQPEAVVLGFFVGNDIADNARRELPVELRDGRLLTAGLPAGLLPPAVKLELARRSHLFQLAWRARRGAPAQPEFPEAGWQATAGLIDRLGRLCRHRGVRLIVLLIPERAQVEASASPDRHLRMAALCRRAGVDVLDLAGRLSGPGLYFPQDGHWTPRGNASAARALFQYLSPRTGDK